MMDNEEGISFDSPIDCDNLTQACGALRAL